MSDTDQPVEESFLQRLDPRLMVPLCLGLVILVFAAHSLFALILVSAAGLLLAMLAKTPWEKLWRTWWSLRWLLLFTLLMHFFLSPGRMLFGSRWLSLDGLLLGSFICAQLSVAVLCGMLLSLTLSAEKLAATITWFLTPLKRLGCPVDDWHRQTFLVLSFLPIVREEYLALREGESGRSHVSMSSSLKLWVERLRALLDSLVERADELARETIEGRSEGSPLLSWLPLRLWAGEHVRVVLMSLLFIAVYLLANGA